MKSIVIDVLSRACFEIKTNRGEVLKLADLTQRPTYSGLLIGHPDEQANKMEIQMGQSGIRDRFKQDLPVTIIPPEVKSFDFPLVGEDGFVSCESLPAITCGAEFTSESTSLDADYSSAIIIWYQDEWGPPSQEIQAKIACLSWREISSNWNW